MAERSSWMFDWRSLRRGVLGTAFILLVLAFLGAILFRMLFVNWIDNYQLPYKFDSRTGAITKLEGHGYYITPPLVVSIHHIDLRPMQVCINANQRVLNCMLVQFNPAGLELFLSWHGRQDYEGPGGGAQGTSGFSEILKSYAYEGSGKTYPFLTIVRVLKNEESK